MFAAEIAEVIVVVQSYNSVVHNKYFAMNLVKLV